MLSRAECTPKIIKKKKQQKIRWTSGGHAPVHPWLNCCEGLQTANCCETTYIQWCVNFGHKQTISSDPGGRDYDVIKQTCNQMGLERGYIPDTSPLQGGGSSLRPILDLHILNRHLRKYTFRMLTHKVLCSSIHPNDCFVMIDLAKLIDLFRLPFIWQKMSQGCSSRGSL